MRTPIMRTPIIHHRKHKSSIGTDWMMKLLSSGSSSVMDLRVQKPSAMASTLCPTGKDVKVLGPKEDYVDWSKEMGDDTRDEKLWALCPTRKDVKRMLGPEEDHINCSWEIIENMMMVEELWGSLPQALVEEVLARLPFKLLFQCRVLSRAWRWNGGRSTNVKKRQQTSHFFEKAISSVSPKWPTYCPVYLLQDGLVGYNSESKAWEKIFDLEIDPCGLLEGIDTTVTSCAGALVCFACVNFLSTVQDINLDSFAGEPQFNEPWSFFPFDNEIYVANVVTNKSKRLPPRPIMQRPNIMHLILVGSKEYKLTLLTQLEPPEGSSCVSKSTIVSQIYHSSGNYWTQKTSKALLPRWRTSLSNFVYLDGVFYIATGGSSPIDPPLLHFHNVEKGTWNTLEAPLPVQRRQLVKYHVLLCGSEVILVARVLDQGPVGSEEAAGDVSVYRDIFVGAHNFLIFKLDLATSQIKEVSRCPREKLAGVAIDQVLAYGDTIYFGGKYVRKTPMMMYNVRKHEWTYHISTWEMPKSNLPLFNGFFYIKREPEQYHWTLSALQPGLNPFAEV